MDIDKTDNALTALIIMQQEKLPEYNYIHFYSILEVTWICSSRSSSCGFWCLKDQTPSENELHGST